MRIGQLADRLGVNPKTIRYYEDIGLLARPARTSAGYRMYDDDAVEVVRFIKAAQRLGLRLDEIREILAFRDRGERPCGYVRDVLRRKVAEIDDRIAELQRMRDQLSTLDQLADTIRDAGASSAGPCPLIGPTLVAWLTMPRLLLPPPVPGQAARLEDRQDQDEQQHPGAADGVEQ